MKNHHRMRSPYLVLLRGSPDISGLSTALITKRNNQRSWVEHDFGVKFISSTELRVEDYRTGQHITKSPLDALPEQREHVLRIKKKAGRE